MRDLLPVDLHVLLRAEAALLDRRLSLACSWWKWKSRSRAALTSCTGTLTSPKLSEPLQSARAIVSLPTEARLERRRQVVALLGLLLGGEVDLLAAALRLIRSSTASR